MRFVIFCALPLNFFSLCLSSFSLLSLRFLATKYTINCLCEGHIFAIHSKHFPGHNHIPFVGYYFFVSIRNAVNPARPVIIKFKSHIRLGQSPRPIGGPCAPLWRWGRRPGAGNCGPTLLWVALF